MTVQNISGNFFSDGSLNIPDNARNVRVTVSSGRGGQGGNEQSNNVSAGGPGGSGRTGTFRYITDYTSRSLTIYVGGNGSNGATNADDSGGGPGGSGVVPGGNGGNAGGNNDDVDFSGAGGGGGGATGVVGSGGAWQVIAGGGGGGGGASRLRNGIGGTAAGDFSGSIGGISGGGAGIAPPGSLDGGGGGGGGGGAPGGAGGTYGVDVGKGTPEQGGQAGIGGGSGYNSSIVSLISSSIFTGTPSVSYSYELVTPEINTFIATPNPQTSGIDGIPNYDTFLSWTTTDAQTVTITNIGSVSADGGTTVTNLPQSTAGVTSPATRTYTLTACAGTVCVTRTLTVSVTNDNTPNNYTVPSPTNLEPSSPTTIQVGPITGIDMVTTVTGGPGTSVSNNNVTFSSSITIQNNQVFYVRATSPPFNTDPNGLTNTSAQLSVTVGTVQRFFTLTTRAPDVNETFNYSNQSDYVPYPDIDTIPDPDADIRNQSNPFIQTNTLLVDDVELGNPFGVEIKTNNPNAQVRIRRSGQATFGTWQDVRSI